MSAFVINVCPKNVYPRPCKIVNVAANKSTVVLPNDQQTTDKLIGRYIFNDSGSVAYYCIGQDADNATNYHGKLQDQQQLDCSNHCNAIHIFSVAGGNFVPTVLVMNDVDVQPTVIRPSGFVS